jgi:hypothetical protein
MNSTKFVVCNSTVTFSLDNQWMATMIAEKCKGDFDTYFFVIDNFIKHANAKGYNRYVGTGALEPSESLLVDKKLLGCCFWRTIGNHGSSSWNIWSKVPSQAMLNQPR